MRQSRFFAPTLRQVKADNAGHALLLRGGFIRQLSAGIYSYLPLGWRVLRNVERVVREEMDAAGGVELLMPALSPTELWAETGRDRLDILFKLNDRKKTEYLLAPTHEEVIVDIIRNGVSSYKQLPQMPYQIQTKFRDEERPRAGLLRGREFVMKDLYSFDRDLAGLDKSFDAMVEAYKRIFTRCGLDYKIVQASGGGIGGFDTQEFMAIAPSGEDEMLFCDADGYAANVEKAESVLPAVENRSDIADSLEEFPTPGIVTIEQLANFEGGAAAEHQIKTLVYVCDGKPSLALVRGDHELNESKLAGATGASEIRAAREDEIVELLGARPGSLGAVNYSGAPVIADETLRGRTHMTTGANRDSLHWRGVSVERDIKVTTWADLRTAQEGEASPRGGGPLQKARCIELGHVFKLGNKYTKAMNCTFLDENGKSQIVEMGCYGIGVSRIVAAVAEAYADERGVAWPRELAPFAVHLLVLDKDAEMIAAAETLYEELRAAKIDVLFDDRNERPGVKFADADLFGAQLQIVVGKSWRESGEVEIKTRAGGEKQAVSTADALARVQELLK
ncbi:MAG TPA: proline--tRNA ligase [Abditibacteriaceae bacterium]|jgi:prolyl-tRNA synthetase